MAKAPIILGINYVLEESWQKTAYWARFISIVQLSMLVLTMLGFLMFGIETLKLYPMTGFSRLLNVNSGYLYATFGVLFGLLAATLYSTFLHFKFGRQLDNAIRSRSQRAFEQAWENLRYAFRIWGGITIVTLLFYIGLIVYVVVKTRGMMSGGL